MKKLIESFAEYQAYIASAKWKAIRQGAMVAAGHRCEACNFHGALVVHHRNYERMGSEELSDVRCFCAPCHKLFHATSRGPDLRKALERNAAKNRGEILPEDMPKATTPVVKKAQSVKRKPATRLVSGWYYTVIRGDYLGVTGMAIRDESGGTVHMIESIDFEQGALSFLGCFGDLSEATDAEELAYLRRLQE